MKHSGIGTRLPIKSLSLLLLACFTRCGMAAAQQSMPDRILQLADPHIFFHENTYYLYGTGNRQGFQVYTSRDLKNWKGPQGNDNGFALKRGDAFGTSGFWAPQVFKHNGKFYMAYVANERIAIAESANPLGPFTQRKKVALASPVKQIDPFIFLDEDGKKYFYHVRVANGGNRIFVAEITDDFSEIIWKTLKECVDATEPWENEHNDKWSVIEGPTVLKHEGFYYLIYSANHFKHPEYAVGYAVSKNPLGPWKKFKWNPILSKENIGENGTGHGDVVKGSAGNMFYVFHTHQSDSVVAPRRTALVRINFFADDPSGPSQLRIDSTSFHFLKSTSSMGSRALSD